MNEDIIARLKSGGLSDEMIRSILANQSPDTLNVRQVETDSYIEIKGLPSGDRFYKNQMGIPVNIKGMPLKVRDTLSLEAMVNSLDYEVLDDVFSKRIQGVSPGDILIGDEKYIMAWLRESTFQSTPLKTSFRCEKCEHINEDKVVSLSDLVISSLPDNITDPMECILPQSKEAIKIRFMRRKDRIRIENHIRENDSIRKLTPVDLKLYELSSVIYGMSITDAMEMLLNQTPTDFAVINYFFLKMNFGFNEKAMLRCEKEECGYLSVVPVPFQSGYFLPKIRPDLSYED